MIEIKASHPIPTQPQPTIFLAGSIEMGTAENWQESIVREFESESVTLLNPRRDVWDASWVQSIDNPVFREQVEWELSALEQADIIVFYFDPATKSPISLLELGLFARSGKTLVVCPDGFWRKGNTDIVCARYGVPQFNSIRDLVSHIRTRLI